jgi:hypothetical protein
MEIQGDFGGATRGRSGDVFQAHPWQLGVVDDSSAVAAVLARFSQGLRVKKKSLCLRADRS